MVRVFTDADPCPSVQPVFIRGLSEWDTDGHGWYGFSRMLIRAHLFNPCSSVCYFESDTDGHGWYGFSRMLIRAHPFNPCSSVGGLNGTRMLIRAHPSHPCSSVCY